MARKEKPVPVRIVSEPIGPSPSYKEPHRYHMSMRQIENGWIVNEHGYKDGKHFDRERFEPGQPAFPGRRESRSVNEKPRSSHKPAPARATSSLPRASSSPGEKKASGFMAVDMAPPPKRAQPPSPLNAPSDAGLPKPKSRAQRLRFAKI